MTVITIDSASFCRGERLADAVAEKLGFERVDDDELFALASRRCGVGADKLRRAVYGPQPFIAGSPLTRNKLVSQVRTAIAELLSRDGWIYHGFCGHLVPAAVTHVMRVCVAATHAFRLEQARAEGQAKEAERLIKRHDEAHAEWTKLLHERGPWDKELYDLFVALQETSPEAAVELISAKAQSPALAATEASKAAVTDFQLAATVQLELTRGGHDVDVSARAGDVEILINEHSLFLERRQRELVAAAGRITGVASATAHPGPRYRAPSIYLDVASAMPSKVLLVDDEKEFVQTLSERLQTRAIPSRVAFSGEQALARVQEEQPEVMVLDLKMPGIDGLEVLRRVKAEHPETEVIILTGHGSEAEEALASELGAFAYLRKPVDINVLTATLQSAYARLAARAQHQPQ